MATKERESAGVGTSPGGSDRMAAARAARGGQKSKTAQLSDREKYAYRTITQARSALKKAQDGLVSGFTVPADLLDACGKINGAVGKMLFD